MEKFQRFAVYYTPQDGPFAQFCASWLGWCPTTGAPVAHPEVAGLPAPVAEITATPRKYGFHGTLKPPFRLAPGTDQQGLEAALSALASRLPPVRMEGLRLGNIGGFVALLPEGDPAPLADLAGACVTELDRFRAPAGEAELARRRASGLSARQEEHLMAWGYPYVLDEFRFHLTLTGRFTRDEGAQIVAALTPVMDPLLPRPFVIGDLTLLGEDSAGRFHVIHRYALTG